MGAAIQPQPFGKYFLLERIATGGMAEIYKAKYRAEGGFEKTLVIKKILPHLARDEEFVTMFRDEAALTVRLNHANIVQVFDFGRNGEDYFLAMEYVQGQNLRAVMRRCQELGAPVPVPFALFAITEVAKGLSYAHSRRDEHDAAMQIVHRDITPSNILVSYEGEFKIADFGIAKAASRATGTQAGMIKGKASYLAPEQVSGKPVDGRADLFSLGAVFWEAVVGKKLFSGDSDFEIMNKITSEPIPKPSEKNAAIPSEIDALVMKCLERNPDKRYQNAAAIQKDLTVLQGKLAGNVTSADISNFLRRLFKKEMEAEKEASKSFARAPLPNEAALIRAANEGATLADPSRAGGSPSGGRSTMMVAAVILVVLLALVGALAMKLGVFSKHDDDIVVHATPTQAPTLVMQTPTAVVESSPQPEMSLIAIDTPEAETPTPRPTHTPSAKSSATPVAKASPTPRASAAPTAEVSTGALGVVKIDSDPWGEIFVDGKDTGRQTPAFDLKVPEGRHEIRLVNSVRKLEARVTVFVDAKTPQKIAVKLAPIQ